MCRRKRIPWWLGETEHIRNRIKDDHSKKMCDTCYAEASPECKVCGRKVLRESGKHYGRVGDDWFIDQSYQEKSCQSSVKSDWKFEMFLNFQERYY